MNKNIQGFIAVAVVGIIGYLAYKKFGKPNNFEVVTNYMNSIYGEIEGGRINAVKKMGKGYIDNWAKAIMNGKNDFEYNGKIYHTQGGNVKYK
jgi:hypothetical protein